MILLQINYLYSFLKSNNYRWARFKETKLITSVRIETRGKLKFKEHTSMIETLLGMFILRFAQLFREDFVGKRPEVEKSKLSWLVGYI